MQDNSYLGQYVIGEQQHRALTLTLVPTHMNTYTHAHILLTMQDNISFGQRGDEQR
jgi:hypothetical protein